MDNLTRNAMLAKQSGLSYGKWKAMQPIVEIKKPKKLKGEKECEGCGKRFEPHDARQRFCEPYCQKYTYNKNHRIRRRDQMRERRAREKYEQGKNDRI